MKSTVPRKFIRTSFYPWKVSFWNLSRTLSGKHLEFCYENLGGVVKTGFSVSKETSLGKVFAKSTNYLQIVISFEYRAKRFRLTVEKKISGVFKLLSTCPWEIYQEKFFLKNFSAFVEISRIIYCHWAKKVWRACQNCILRIYRNILKKN